MIIVLLPSCWTMIFDDCPKPRKKCIFCTRLYWIAIGFHWCAIVEGLNWLQWVGNVGIWQNEEINDCCVFGWLSIIIFWRFAFDEWRTLYTSWMNFRWESDINICMILWWSTILFESFRPIQYKPLRIRALNFARANCHSCSRIIQFVWPNIWIESRYVNGWIEIQLDELSGFNPTNFGWSDRLHNDYIGWRAFQLNALDVTFCLSSIKLKKGAIVADSLLDLIAMVIFRKNSARLANLVGRNHAASDLLLVNKLDVVRSSDCFVYIANLWTSNWKCYSLESRAHSPQVFELRYCWQIFQISRWFHGEELKDAYSKLSQKTLFASSKYSWPYFHAK